MRRTARFLAAYARDRAPGVVAEEVLLPVDGELRETTRYRPAGRGRLPGWVVLHGLTVPGRHHRGLVRFARALAASGAVVLVPDVPAWRALRLDLEAARATLHAGVLHLADDPGVRPGGVGVIGFSFGATQALVAAADPSLHGALRTVLGFGGYADPQRMLRCLFTGEHEWDGTAYRLDPDPYGRWILCGNYLTLVPGYEGMAEVEARALSLALESGRRGTFAWDPEYDPLKAALREGLSPEEQAVWDVVAAPAGVRPPEEPARALADAFAAAALEKDPGLDPRPRLPGLRGRIILSHGRADRLIPFTETLRMRALLPPHLAVTTAVTGLFAHSSHAGLRHPVAWARETGRFVRLLDTALESM